MAVFLYPKVSHTRKLNPRVFKRYQTYKRYLQAEFERVCVYCREPDTTSPNVNFGVDHYRPKSIPRFRALGCDYGNLYYCCGSCNSRKNSYWPSDEKNGPYVVNPCDHVMAKHLRFNSKTCEIEPLTPDGEHTKNLLQLNEPDTVAMRQSILIQLESLDALLKKYQTVLKNARLKLNRNEIDQLKYDQVETTCRSQFIGIDKARDRLTGKTPLPPLAKIRMSVQVLP